MSSVPRPFDAGADGDGSATAALLPPTGHDAEAGPEQSAESFLESFPLSLPPVPSIWVALRQVLWPVYVPSALFGMADGVIMATIPLLARSIGCNDRMVGVVAAARKTGKLLGDVPAGMLFSSLGPSKTMQAGMVGVGVTAFAAATLTMPLMLWVALALAGCCESLFTVSRGSLLRNLVAGTQRGRVMSMLGGTNRMTRTLAPLLGGAASHYHGPGSPLYLRALFAVVGAALVRGTIPADTILDPESNKGKRQGPRSLRETFRMHGNDLATGGVGAFILMFIRECRNVIIALKGDDLGLTHIQIGTAFAVGYACDSLLFIPAGYVMDTYGRKYAGLPAYLLLSVGLAAVPLVASLPGLILVSIVMGLGNGCSAGLNVTLGTDFAPKDAGTGNFMGAWSLLCDLGATAGPVFLGAIAHSYSLDMAATGAAIVGVAGFLWFGLLVQETRLSDEVVPKRPAPRPLRKLSKPPAT